MLVQAGTTGFAVYPAEDLGDQGWKAYGQPLATLPIARRPGVA